MLTPEYLNKKMVKMREANLDNLILAVSKQLTLSEAVSEELHIIRFTKRLPVIDVLELADSLAE